jgi:hypothetical protein
MAFVSFLLHSKQKSMNNVYIIIFQIEIKNIIRHIIAMAVKQDKI